MLVAVVCLLPLLLLFLFRFCPDETGQRELLGLIELLFKLIDSLLLLLLSRSHLLILLLELLNLSLLAVQLLLLLDRAELVSQHFLLQHADALGGMAQRSRSHRNRSDKGAREKEGGSGGGAGDRADDAAAAGGGGGRGARHAAVE